MVTLKHAFAMFGCAAAFAALPLLGASPASATTCPNGTVPSSFAGVCSEGSGGGNVAAPPQVAQPPSNVMLNPNGLASVDGVPCTPQKIGKCIALQESQG